MTLSIFMAAAAGLIVARTVAELWLATLNQRHVRQHANAVPESLREIIDPATYKRSVDYTLVKSRFGQVQEIYSTAVLLVVLFSGVLPWAFNAFQQLGTSAWIMGLFLFVAGVGLRITGLPLDWYAQFRLEDRFGFNTTTPKIWWSDRVKGLLLGVALGYPLLVLILKLVDWTGPWWWLWAAGAVLGFQLLGAFLAPVLILPLFNKFTPLPEGSLRDRLWRLAERTRFQVRNIQVMDGSKRSTHSNAFFIGFGRFRKIALFDTLIEQLSETELEAVLAHEIGHFKKKHILRMLAFSALSTLAGFYILSVLATQRWFYEAFGFGTDQIAPALLLFTLLSGAATFWFMPLMHAWSRRYEYQADAYASKAMGESRSLIGALRKLTEKNLSNLTPHPLYSAVYYSHPALLEREKALRIYR